MHWDAVGRALVAVAGVWAAAIVLRMARAGERGAVGVPEGGPPRRRAWTAFIGPALALAVGIGLAVWAAGGR